MPSHIVVKIKSIYIENKNIGDIMINEKVAVQYNGGKKQPVDWYV